MATLWTASIALDSPAADVDDHEVEAGVEMHGSCNPGDLAAPELVEVYGVDWGEGYVSWDEVRRTRPCLAQAIVEALDELLDDHDVASELTVAAYEDALDRHLCLASDRY